MNKRLKIITIAVGIVYTVIVFGQIYREMNGFAEAFKLGYNEGRNEAMNDASGLPRKKTLFLSLKPEDGPYAFPTTALNQLPVKAGIEKMRIQVTYMKEEVPKGVRVVHNWAMVLLIPILVYVIIMVPIQVFRIVRSITKNKIFDPWNTKRLRKIGNALLLLYVVILVLHYVEYKIATHVVHVVGYSVQMDWGNYTLVLLGVVVLLFAEVLKISVQLKEEQDLTV